MHSSNSKNPYQKWLFCSIITTYHLLTCMSISDPRITQSGLYCGNTRGPAYSTLIRSFVKEMESLSQLITNSNSHFAAVHLNSTFPMYALAQCHQDLSQTDCLLCFASSRTKIPRCLPSPSARIFFDGCFLRYDNYDFFNESVSVLDSVQCSNDNDVRDDPVNLEFVLGNVTRKAVEDEKLKFGAWGFHGVYALGQCWGSLGKDGCRVCLEKASDEVKRCRFKKEGRAMNAGCYLRFSTHKFYNDGPDLGVQHGLSGLGIAIAIVLAVAAFLMLSLLAAYVTYIRILKERQERNNLEKVSISFNKSSLNFKYETLEKATDYFNASRKIGQGGAGSVYIGTLQNGENVAVKRLIFNTRQWVDDFFNEVNLITGIQHKNLVKLLGCSIEGPESLLVYEYVHNRSLDHFIFGMNKTRILNWRERFNIIVGTAEGLAYLHGGSQVRIIHRDIKSSNVLLDENLAPKIADFGLVRCFGADVSHLSTGIAGTIGYMAPEYLIRGQLTEKADVYSFGVLVLEVVMGKRCNAFIEESKSLLQTVWQLYKSNRLDEAVDRSLKGEFPGEEVCKVLQIGLLCTQASVSIRPSMKKVVEMLSNGGDGEVAEPKQPPFMNATVLQQESSSNSCVSNARSKGEAAYSCTSSSESCSSICKDHKSQLHMF
ncbi:Cysteine-rich receptor-like protein kinase 42 [Euphorbia peplus]|nr:Cysteine-rich receptor-like protein kinase 42 [Euphorbia peplus]